MTFEEFAGPFMGFREVFNRDMSDDGVALWYAAFSDIPVAEFTQAVARFIREAGAKDFPTPGEIRKLCPSGMKDDDRSLAAYQIASRGARQWGGDRSVDFDDPLINATIRRMGGWERFCEQAGDTWKEREFRLQYQSVARTGTGDSSALPGMAARVNVGLLRPEVPQCIETGLPVHPVAKRLTRQATARLGAGPATRHLTSIGNLPPQAESAS